MKVRTTQICFIGGKKGGWRGRRVIKDQRKMFYMDEREIGHLQSIKGGAGK